MPSPPSSSPRPGRRIIVSNHLPLSGRPPSLDPEPVPSQLPLGLPPHSPITFVGTLPSSLDPSLPVQPASSPHRFIPVHLPPTVLDGYYHSFCKHYLWPLLHSHSSSSLLFLPSSYRDYVSANLAFADAVVSALDDPDEDYVWIHDYHLLLLPTLLRRRSPRARIGFFLHSPFPSSEIFRTVPVRLDLLRSLLNADLLGFHTFDYARHFLSSCSRLLGIPHRSRRGYISLDYYGRDVQVKISPVGIDVALIQSSIASVQSRSLVADLSRQFANKIIILGIDDMDVFKGIGLKFSAMGQLLSDHPELRGRVVLVQIANPARSRGPDVQEVQNEASSVAADVNRRFGTLNYTPIVLINQPISTDEKAAYYAIAECCVVNAVRDGMNLVPYKYTVCREVSPILKGLPKKSVIVVSEFIGCSPSLSGAIRVNPWNIEAVAEAMNYAITMPELEKQLRHERHYKYISSHDVAYWARSFDQDLQKVCGEHSGKRCWGMGLGLGFRVIALDPSFTKLDTENIVSAYQKASRRLVLLDYDGTMMPECSLDRSPTGEVISVLGGLCEDENNAVFMVSGRGKDALSRWFGSINKLGIAAEYGYFTRWHRDAQWESCLPCADFDWKTIVEPIMRLYTEATDGSYIEHKESTLAWRYQEADPDFGSCQAKELLDHLESVLANHPVVVKRGQHLVEVKPQGVSKGKVVQDLIEGMLNEGKPPDFVLCIGDDQSDEDMFEIISNSSCIPSSADVFACTVGKKPSKAKYYLDDTVEVVRMLRGLANVSMQLPPDDGRIHVPFEGSFEINSGATQYILT